MVQQLLTVRFLVAVLVMFAAFLLYCHKVDLSVNIVCMVNHTALATQTNTSIKPDRDGPFLWTKHQQGFLLTGFFWGYLFSQIPGSLIGAKHGPKYTILIAVLISGICAACYKVSAFVSLKLLWGMRFVVGLCAGMILPCSSQLWTVWAPVRERSFLIGFAMSGAHLGSVVTLPLGGILCIKGIDGGWPSLFYVIAASCGVWSILWFFFFTNSPETNPFISEEEKKYIAQHTSVVTRKFSIRQVPWREMVTNVPFLADVACHMCLHWGFYTLLTSTPNYFKDVFCLDIKSNGLFSSIPYLCMWFVTSISGFVADFAIHRQLISRTSARKVSNLLGSLPVAACLLGLAYAKKSQKTLAIALLALSQAFFGITFGSGYVVVPNDIAGHYAGIVFAVANTVGTIPGVIAPYLTGYMTKHRTRSEWKNVFIVAASAYLAAGVIFTIFGSSELQDFAKHKEVAKHAEELKAMNDEAEEEEEEEPIALF